MTPSVDVVMPVRNVTAYLDAAIESVFAQEGIRPRLIIVDAGSDSPVVLSSPWKTDARITLIRSEAGLNAGGGRNLGCTMLESGFLTFLDADDLWPPTRSRRLIEQLTTTGSDMTLGQVEHFSESDAGHLHVPSGLRPAYLAGGTILTRSAWERVGPYKAELRTGEYIDWYNRFKGLGLKESVIADVTLRRRVHARSTTATQTDDRSEYLKVVREWMNRNA